MSEAAAGADVVIQGAAAVDRFGFSVSGAGDVDGDGVDHLLVGAYDADPAGRIRAGASYVVFGAPPCRSTPASASRRRWTAAR